MAGLKAGSFKLFLSGKSELNKNNIELPKDAKINSLYEPGIGINLFAIESLGKPGKWNRFPQVYESSTWSCSGSYTDSIVFIPTKDLMMAGFSLYKPKDDLKYYVKYKVEIGDKIVQEDPVGTE